MPSRQKSAKKPRKTIAARLAEEREACARLAEEHKCSYDCYSDISGELLGTCCFRIAEEIRNRKTRETNR